MDIRTKYITPAIVNAGWDSFAQMREEYPITKGRIIARGKTCKREMPLKADYVLFYKPNKPIAIIEAKDNNHTIGDGMQQALNYAKMMDVPFVFSSNGDGFLFHNKYITEGDVEVTLSLDEFPSPETLWQMYHEQAHINPAQDTIIDEPYYSDNPDKQPRYYQMNAINKTVEAIANGENRVLLVMATGTGKTYTAFQIIWRLWKAGIKKRILFLADRTALISQTFTNDFAPFKDKMTWVTKQNFDTAHEIYLALYQGLTGEDEDANSLFEQFSPGFFDLIVVDECHRGSAKADSQWREVLEYFTSATQIGLTATPKETNAVSNIDYFGEPIYTYSLKQGIDDGFLAPYRVIRVFFDRDVEGFVPYEGQLDDNGEVIDNRVYNTTDFDKNLILEKRTKLVAKTVSDYLKKHDCRMDKTIFFCVDQEHADRMRRALINENADMCALDDRYVMRITANDEEGVKQLDNFRNVESQYPVLVTTSKLLSTGVDVQTVKYIVLDSNIRSMTEFKQIIGRGTRVREDLGKLYFTIFDFRDVTRLFHDPDFDGPIEKQEGFDPKKPDTEPDKPPKVTPPDREKKQKFVLGGTPVTVSQQHVQYLDKSGNLITESLIDYTKRNVLNQYASLYDFLSAWNDADRKQAVIEELEKRGVFFDDLCDEIGKDLDPFDLILHIVFDQPPHTRKERAEHVRKRNYFTKYGEKAAEILDALLTKYADSGLDDLENVDVLKVDPIKQYGTQVYIINSIFGGIEKYREAIKELETAIYAA
ncbi:MAG: DEAD/DEAH box helicase family protein [Clostridia bacterium]|nr:DEAD/DEAH box helicase family protein [Clostridia bacterium]